MITAVPSATWRMLAQGVMNQPLPKGADAVWDAGAGYLVRLAPRTQKLLQRAECICDLEKTYSEMSKITKHFCWHKPRFYVSIRKTEIEYQYLMLLHVLFRIDFKKKSS